jgi:hypothetical protein
MAEKLPATPQLPQLKDRTALAEIQTRSTRSTRLQSDQRPARPLLGLWLSIFLIVGLLVLIFASSSALNWLKTVKVPTSSAPVQTGADTLNIGRGANYAGVKFTLVNAQYATSFVDDTIHSGAAVVRLNMRASNTSSSQVSFVYYETAHLLGSGSSSYKPTNVSLSASLQPKAGASGWLDFAVPAGLQLNTLQLQLGSTLLGESLVTLPFSGPFDGARYNDRTVAQNLSINYYFSYITHQLLIYQLTSVDVLYSYLGSQVKAGSQYYVLNFRVTNPNGNMVSPGYGYDYVRLIYSGGPPNPPVDNTLPYGFNALKTTGGRVVFVGPAGMKALTLDFLVQYGSGGSNYNVSL